MTDAGEVPRMLVRRSIAGVIDLVMATTLAAGVAEVVAQVLRGRLLSWVMTEFNYVVLFLISIACVSSTLVFAYLWHQLGATPGTWPFGLTVRQATTRRRLSAVGAFSRWVLLYAPITLWVYPLVVQTVFDPGHFLMLIEYPAWLYQAMLLPIAWYALLCVSVLVADDGRGWHDRLSGSLVTRSAAGRRALQRPIYRIWFCGTLVVAAFSAVMGASATDDVLIGCDGPIGIGGPSCDAQLSASSVMLAASLLVLAACGIATIAMYANSTRRR